MAEPAGKYPPNHPQLLIWQAELEQRLAFEEGAYRRRKRKDSTVKGILFLLTAIIAVYSKAMGYWIDLFGVIIPLEYLLGFVLLCGVLRTPIERKLLMRSQLGIMVIGIICCVVIELGGIKLGTFTQI